METCELRSECALFQTGRLHELGGLAHLFEERYCKGGKDRCLRYQIAQQRGVEWVPADLYPNDQDAARSLLAQEGSSS